MSIRDDFFASQAVAALWDVAVSIKRGNPLPLDSNSVFKSYADLETYASGVLAYPGQIVAVVNVDSTEIYFLDQELAIKPVGSVPAADNKSIVVTDGVLSLHDYENAYYKYVAAEKDENGIEISAAHYEKVTVSEENPWIEQLEPRVVLEDDKYVIGWYEPDPSIHTLQTDIKDLNATVEDIIEEIGKPSQDEDNPATGLYLELEKKANAEDVYTKTETERLIANADHLKRKIFEDLDSAQSFIDANQETAEQYIYLISVENAQEANDKYDEYMLIDGVLELVGKWEIDLSDYFTEAELQEFLKDYYTSSQVDNILNEYAKSTDLEGYYTSSQVDALLEKYVVAEEGKSLVPNDEIEKLATVERNAEENYIKSVQQDQFVVSEAGQLSLSDAVVGALLTESDKNKLNALVIEGDKVEISGTVNASNVQDLDLWVKQNRNSVDGLFSVSQAEKLNGIEAGAQKNFITAVDPAEFTVDDEGYLTLNNKLPFTSLSTDFTVTEANELVLANDYVLQSVYDVEVGDLNTLIHLVPNKPNSTLVDEINYINERLKWGELTE